MLWPLNNRNVLRVFVCSLPKAGTHLVMSCLEQFPKLRYGGLCLDNTLSFDNKNIANEGEDAVVIGVDDPNKIKTAVVSDKLKKIKGNRFIAAHVPYTQRMDEILAEHGYRNIVIVRDPRDVVASHVPFVLKTKEHYLHDRYKSNQDFDRNLMDSIEGFRDEQHGVRLESIRARVEGMCGWSNSKSALMVRFEELIGGQGGGDSERQLAVIHDIAHHIGLHLGDVEIRKVAENMFGGSYTFRKGNIGGWHEVFKDEHKSRFKELAGDLLISLGYENDLEW